MSEHWLKLIGSSKNPCPEHYSKPYVDFSKSKRPRHVHPGDRVVLYAAGGSKRLFALAKVTSEVYDITSETIDNKDYETYPYRVNIEYIFRVPVSAGIHIEEITTPQRNLLSAVQGSYLRLKPEEFNLAKSNLQEAAPD
ncbi:MAG: hypothetical protein QOJ70_223 [Acidobacteriota bacterium]|jgi:hypothetical protein|nr:hypothetical protein [Acidobacteriota bacterium]